MNYSRDASAAVAAAPLIVEEVEEARDCAEKGWYLFRGIKLDERRRRSLFTSARWGWEILLNCCGGRG